MTKAFATLTLALPLLLTATPGWATYVDPPAPAQDRSDGPSSQAYIEILWVATRDPALGRLLGLTEAQINAVLHPTSTR